MRITGDECEHCVVSAAGTAAAVDHAEISSVEEEPDRENWISPSFCLYSPREAVHWRQDWCT